MTQIKVCSKCSRPRVRSDFAKYSRGADGLQAWCKACKRDADRRRRDSLRQRQFVKYADKACGWCNNIKPPSEFYADPSDLSGLSYLCRECNSTKQRWRYLKSSHKFRVRAETYRMVSRGDIQGRDKCEDCGVTFSADSPLEIHHLSYDRPDNIAFLCRACHGAKHMAE